MGAGEEVDRSPSRRDFLAQTGGLVLAALADGRADEAPAVAIPEWVHGVTRMGFLSPGEVPRAAAAGVQVVHTNVVWPYFPLRRNGGGLSQEDDRRLRDLVAACGRHGMRLVL